MKSNAWPEPCQIYSYFPAAQGHPSLTCSELNCLVTATKGCKQSRKQFTQSRYPAAPRPRVEPATAWSQVWRPTRCSTTQPFF